jgi:hypothetical protein
MDLRGFFSLFFSAFIRQIRVIRVLILLGSKSG